MLDKILNNIAPLRNHLCVFVIVASILIFYIGDTLLKRDDFAAIGMIVLVSDCIFLMFFLLLYVFLLWRPSSFQELSFAESAARQLQRFDEKNLA